jgi:hypothetical protein
MKIITLVLAVFTCLVSIGLTVVMYLSPETSILNSVSNLQKSGQEIAGLWLFLAALLLGALAGLMVLFSTLTAHSQKFRKVTVMGVALAAVIAILDLGMANWVVAQQKIHIAWVDFMILALCTSYFLCQGNFRGGSK